MLAAVRGGGEVARVSIVRETGLSPATVTSITADLLSEGLLEEVIDADSARARGRPPVALRIRPDARLVGGAKISDRRITVALMDFGGVEILHHAIDLEPDYATPGRLVATLWRAVGEALARTGRAHETLSCLGVGLPGYIEADSGLVHWSPSFRDRNVGLGALLSEAAPCPVVLENDANLAALAERWFGYGRNERDFLVVTVENGVGMGIVLDGRLFRGARGVGAEFGHTKVQLDGAPCRCGQRGCLEAYVADYALLRESRDVLGRSADPAGPGPELEALFEAAGAGEPQAQQILDRASRMFAIGLANLVNIFDPGLIILSGERMRRDFLCRPEVLALMRENALALDRPPPRVRVHKWGDRLWAMGAAALAIEVLTDHAVCGAEAAGEEATGLQG